MKQDGIILFGGTFDPIHRGHLSVAEYALDYLKADTLIFIPAARSPHKQSIPLASGPQRMEMIRMAIKGLPRFEVSDCELNRPQPSYTIDTICWFRSRYKGVPLYWLAGVDTVAELSRWHRIGDILELCRVCIMYRGGFEKSFLDQLKGKFTPGQIEQIVRDVITTPLVDISSTQIRRQIIAGEDVTDSLPAGVLEFIRQNRLYSHKK